MYSKCLQCSSFLSSMALLGLLLVGSTIASNPILPLVDADLIPPGNILIRGGNYGSPEKKEH